MPKSRNKTKVSSFIRMPFEECANLLTTCLLSLSIYWLYIFYLSIFSVCLPVEHYIFWLLADPPFLNIHPPIYRMHSSWNRDMLEVSLLIFLLVQINSKRKKKKFFREKIKYVYDRQRSCWEFLVKNASNLNRIFFAKKYFKIKRAPHLWRCS